MAGVDRRSEPNGRAVPLTTSSSMRVAALPTVANGFVDAYTFLAHGGVFANAQTANVVLFGVGLARRDVVNPLAHLWPILAFPCTKRDSLGGPEGLEPSTYGLKVRSSAD